MGESLAPGQPRLQRDPVLERNKSSDDGKEATGCGRADSSTLVLCGGTAGHKGRSTGLLGPPSLWGDGGGEYHL